jgi:hypothetical protein
VDGDYYLRSNGDYYGPKASGSWGSVVGSLLGATGSTGPTGPTGPAGPGLPTGGTAGQWPRKASSTDYDVAWDTLDVTDVSGAAPLASPTFTGDPKAPTPAAADNDTSIATTAFVQGEIAAKAPLASPAFTGNPTAPTASAADNDTSIATTAFVQAAIAALIASAPGALDTLDELAAAMGDDANFATTMTNALALKAPLAGPTFTGTVTIPTVAGSSDNTTKAASTAFVQAVVAALAQPLDADLTSIAALTTTSYGRAFLALANQAALMALLLSADATTQGIVELATSAEVITGTDTVRAVTPAGFKAGLDKQPEVFVFALSDETTAITTGTAKVTWRAPFAMTITGVRASLTVASSSGIPTVDINEAGTTIMAVSKLTIDASELTSVTAATAAVVSDTSIADDAEITFDIDVAGTGAKGLKVTIYATRA